MEVQTEFAVFTDVAARISAVGRGELAVNLPVGAGRQTDLDPAPLHWSTRSGLECPRDVGDSEREVHGLRRSRAQDCHLLLRCHEAIQGGVPPGEFCTEDVIACCKSEPVRPTFTRWAFSRSRPLLLTVDYR